jgi:hypothetical protein
MGWFGPSTDDVWRQLSNEVGAEFVSGSFLGFSEGTKVRAHVGPWTVTLDITTYGRTTITRIRAPYMNPEGFQFTIDRKSPFHILSKLLRLQDIEVGDARFDEAFVIKGNDQDMVRALFSNPKIRRLIQNQPRIHLEVKHSEGWFGPTLPDDVDELYFHENGVIKDIERLKALIDLFAAVLVQLCKIEPACKQGPGIEL